MFCDSQATQLSVFVQGKLKQSAVGCVLFAIEFGLAMTALNVGFQLYKEPRRVCVIVATVRATHNSNVQPGVHANSPFTAIKQRSFL
jgi:hypothetical protein